MSAFVDASVLVAILLKELDWESLADRLDDEPELLLSPVTRWEAILAVRRDQDWTFGRAQALVDGFCESYRFNMVAIGKEEADIALEAAALYGRASGHAAALNMGDCFAYACAKANASRLLYKGDDFSSTDLA